ncbi:MAG: hypothetical protein WDW36_000571 [Sanguina aurantia]
MQAPPRLSSKDKVYTEEGVVTIQALEQKWLQPTTDVLTEAFADAKGYTQYSEFLRRKIRLYLQEHMELLPQAVVLVAFLTPHTPPEPPREQQEQLGASERSSEPDQSLNPFLTGSPASPPTRTAEGSTHQEHANGNGSSSSSHSETTSSSSTTRDASTFTSGVSSSRSSSSSSSTQTSPTFTPAASNLSAVAPTPQASPSRSASPSATTAAAGTNTGAQISRSTPVNSALIWATAAAIMDRGSVGDTYTTADMYTMTDDLDTASQDTARSTGSAVFSDDGSDSPDSERAWNDGVYRWSLDDCPLDIPYTGESGPSAAEYSNGSSSSSSSSDGKDGGVTSVPVAPKSIILGSAEVSFASITRSSYVTLNPPRGETPCAKKRLIMLRGGGRGKGDCGYICNMAVMPQQRGKGIGMLLMGSVEEVAAIVGKQQLFLHLRFQDVPAAALYSKAGFSVKGEDWAAVTLLGWDRRKLMTKSLPAPSRPQ